MSIQRKIKIEEHFLHPPYKIEEEIKAYGDQLGRATNIKADHTHWHLEKDNKFNILTDFINENYPKHTIEELWGCTYRQGDFTQAHTHYGFDRGFVWFVDTSSTCSPLIFPDPEHPWMPPLRVIQPKQGKIVVFSGMDLHYVPPQVTNYERVVLSANMRLNKEVHN
jgi:hypothetical protein|tara:strand:- start:22 stop:519 length:498 start_codon:yes stop_codon:yes gene_type:complete